MRARRCPEVARLAAGEAAAAHLAASPEFARSRRVACFSALSHEIASDPLIGAVCRAGKEVLLPRMVLSRGFLEFVRVGSEEELGEGPQGAREPRSGEAETLDEDDLVVVPGLAFDRQGNRLGHGGGWYDRTLARESMRIRVRAIGFAYDAQIVDEVPHAARDVRMDAIVTESGVHRVRRQERPR
jgi:5-formyltetrahydrofolate cyclo-ligase